MEAVEIYNLGIHQLITKIFSTDWSEDNQISIITEAGVHILELQPNPLCATPLAKFKRSFVYPSNYLPCEPFVPILHSLINNCEREDFYSLIFEEALVPKLPHKNSHEISVVAVDWSPKTLLQPSKCLLTILTSAGTIDLALKVKKSWYSVCKFSTIWWEIVKTEFNFDPLNIDVNTLNAEKYRNCARRLQGTAITWSPLYQASSTAFSYFVTAYRSCDLVIWKISRTPELSMKVEPTITFKTRLDIDTKISKLLWINLERGKYLILIGFFDGRIYGLKVTETNDIITENSLEKYEAFPDRLHVSCLKEWSRTHDEINIIVTKNYFLIVMTLNYEGKLLRQQHIQLLGYSISGLVLIDNDRVIVTTQDSKFYCITMNEKAKLIFQPINHDMKTSKVQFLGVARSPSGATFINVTSPNGLYDHLMNKEPSTLQLFHLKIDELDPWKLLNKTGSTLNSHWECLELIRIKAARESVPEKYLPIIPEVMESLSIHQLRFIMWMTLISDVLKQKKVMKKIDNVIGEISEAQPLIFVYSASAHIIKLAEREILTEDMRRCIHFLRLYLEVFLAGEDDNENQDSIAIKHAKIALELSSELELIETERCNLCGEIVTELPWNTSSCPKGHKLPRCALTLLQITCLKYRNCPVCARIFHPSLDEIYEDVRCLYCDVSALYDTRLVGMYDIEEKCENLSIPSIEQIQASRAQESETSVVDERSNKKRRTTETDTFTLDENKDEEMITDSWRED